MARHADSNRGSSSSSEKTTHRPPRQRWLLLVGLSLFFALLFTGAVEVVVRLTEVAAPSLRSLPLPGELSGVLQSDDDLFWMLKPNNRASYRGVTVTTNSLGHRGPEPGPPQEGELRILSLGESGAFGIGVADGETYAAVLEKMLRTRLPDRPVTVLNGGVPAWSSFQSRMYLELRGLDLEPDLVLFYHEMNDYLPASLRGSDNTEVDFVRSDRQVYFSRKSTVWRRLQQRSALFRFLSFSVARRRLQELEESGPSVSPYDIGLPEIGVVPRLRKVGKGRFGLADLAEDRLPTRVLPEERRGILEELLALCQREAVQLVLIHPTYFKSQPHACGLTRFAAERDVPLFEAYEVLHPAGPIPEGSFRDHGHPSVKGHAQLAAALASFLEERELLD